MVTEFNVQYGNSGPSINSRISNDSSIQHQDYEIVPESSVQYGDSKPPPLHQSTSNEESSEDRLAENIEYGDYSSLHRDLPVAFAQPTVYTKLHLYANISSKETFLASTKLPRNEC